MKKYLFIFLLLFSTKVKAVTFYSDYSNFSSYSTNYIESDDITNVEVLENKKYYVSKKVDNINGEFYDVETYTSELTNIKPEEKENRVITKYDKSYYLDIPKVRYILLSNISDITVESIPLYIKGERYYYEFRCNDCFFGSYIHLSDTDYYKIDLGDYYDVRDIELVFIFNGQAMDFGMTIEYINDDVVFYKDTFKFKVIEVDISSISTYDSRHLLKDKLIKSIKDDSKHQLYVEDIQYSYVDTIYKRYDLVKEYVDYETDNYDIEKLYRYQKRDKIEIMDNITITDYKYNLDDYIKCSTEYNVTDNIDIKKNGIYSIIINFLGKEIKRNVVVNIKDNIIKLDNENKINELNNAINKKEHEIKTIIEEKQKVNEEVNTLNQIIDKEKKKDSGKVIISDGNRKRIIIILFLIILLLLLLRIFKKKTS